MMAKEQRLIDANAVDYENIMGSLSQLRWLNAIIENQPTVDAVPVVRCKDCGYAKRNYLVNGLCLCEKLIHDVVKGEMPRNTLMCEDDFCSYGERKAE